MHSEQEQAEKNAGQAKAEHDSFEETLEGIDQAQGREEDTAEEVIEASSVESADPVDPMEALKAELEETKLNWARERADFSNYRKRMIDEMGKARAAAVSNFARSLMPVVDNLDLVLAAPTEDPAVKNFVIGVDMIRTEFLSILGREGIQPQVEVGGDFDPYLMEALELEEREGFEGEKVEHVYKKAYVQMLEGGERLVLRPATVKVVRGKRVEPAQESGSAEASES